jgi:hypothetical protein
MRLAAISVSNRRHFGAHGGSQDESFALRSWMSVVSDD